MSRKLLFIFNPKSGKGQIREHLVDIVDTMVKADYEVTIYTTQKQGDAVVKVEKEAANYDRIVCSGGDGTLDEVVTGVIRSGVRVPIGYIPAGSTNDFGESLNIPKDMVEAAKIAVGEEIFPCDMGELNRAVFVYVAAFGIFTEVSYSTPQEMKNLLGHTAYILEGIKHLADIPIEHLTVEVDEEKSITGEFIFGMITNSVSVGGFKGITGHDVGLDDGVFEVLLIRRPHDMIELNEIVLYMLGQLPETKMVYSFKTSEFCITSEKPVSWTVDGEFGGKYTFMDIRNLHQRVDLLVPRMTIEQSMAAEEEK